MCLAGSANAAEALRIAVSKSPLSLPMFVAEAAGHYAAEGLAVTTIECEGGPRCLGEVFAARADIATSSEMPIAFNGFVRDDYALFATIATAGNNIKLIADRRAGITVPGDLAGKRIGAVIGSASHYFLDLYLLAINVDPRQLNIVDLQPEQLVEALRSRRVDAIAAWEPYGYLAVKALGTNAHVLPRVGAYAETFNLVTSRRLVGTRDAALTSLLRAVERAQRFIRDRPDEARAILRKRLQREEDFMAWVWPTTVYHLGLDQSLVSTMESEARWAVRERQVGGDRSMRPDFSRLIHTAPLQAAKPSALKLNR